MINRAWLLSLGLTDDQAALVLERLDKQYTYIKMLISEGVDVAAVTVARQTDLDTLDWGNEDLMRLKIREEFGGKRSGKRT